MSLPPALIRRLAWVSGTTIPIYLMLTVLAPPGIGSVPWLLVVIIVFCALFVTLIFREPSSLWNGVIAFVFWLPLVVLHLMRPGSETVKNGEVLSGVIAILGVAYIHAAIQYLARAGLIMWKNRTPDSA